ncbi:MAG TPA: hypothetical protein VKS82_05165 [Streptosporangiaceae bacterium]|nr:hypothetical protein [Streptosporangiaceae bacterium]
MSAKPPAGPPHSREHGREHGHRRRDLSRLRVPVAGALAVATAVAASGCSQFDKAMGQQEEVVIFQPNTPNSVKLKVRSACSHIPHAVVEPLPTDHKLSDEIYNVRYQVGSASDSDLTKLSTCLTRFPSVVGLETNTPGGND